MGLGTFPWTLNVLTPPASGGYPPMGRFVFSCQYTSKINAGNVVYVLNPCGYTPSAQAERHPSFGVYTKVQEAIDIPQDILDTVGLVPKPGDFFIGHDGKTYNVVAWQTNSIFFVRVVGFDPILSYQLTDTINILPPVDSTDAYLSPKTTAGSNTAWNGLAARIQFLKEDLEDWHGIQYMRPTYQVWVQNLEFNLLNRTELVATSGEYNGQKFRIISNDNIEQLEELEMLTVTIDPI
jgi:hypothetical protein